jgi:TIR domain
VPDICVIHLSDDNLLVEKLVRLLRERWSVWWDRDVSHGDWEEKVRKAIPDSRAVVPVLSDHVKGIRSSILKEEMRLAAELGRPILPFIIGQPEIPLGFGSLVRTEAPGWLGERDHPGVLELVDRLESTMPAGGAGSAGPGRVRQLALRAKMLQLPAFAFSVSSHETQVNPLEGVELLNELMPSAVLVSSYDAAGSGSNKSRLRSAVRRLSRSSTVVVLDSGNYEAYRKHDRYSKAHPDGWSRESFLAAARSLSPDMAFSFDSIPQRRDDDSIVRGIVNRFRTDDRALRGRGFPLCPVVHMPAKRTPPAVEHVASVVSRVVQELDPPIVAIPERELGDGLVQRAESVRGIRSALNSLGKYYPLHLLGTGNPISMAVLAVAGADMFDGLEWCRTSADYRSGHLFHFQQFDCFGNTSVSRMRSHRIRSFVEDPEATYAQRALSYNVDYFTDFVGTMQSMINAGQGEQLIRTLAPEAASDLLSEHSP